MKSKSLRKLKIVCFENMGLSCFKFNEIAAFPNLPQSLKIENTKNLGC